MENTTIFLFIPHDGALSFTVKGLEPTRRRFGETSRLAADLSALATVSPCTKAWMTPVEGCCPLKIVHALDTAPLTALMLFFRQSQAPVSRDGFFVVYLFSTSLGLYK